MDLEPQHEKNLELNKVIIIVFLLINSFVHLLNMYCKQTMWIRHSPCFQRADSTLMAIDKENRQIKNDTRVVQGRLPGNCYS